MVRDYPWESDRPNYEAGSGSQCFCGKRNFNAVFIKKYAIIVFCPKQAKSNPTHFSEVNSKWTRKHFRELELLNIIN